MIVEHELVVLMRDLPEYSLAAGDVGTVVHVHAECAGNEFEFINGDSRRSR